MGVITAKLVTIQCDKCDAFISYQNLSQLSALAQARSLGWIFGYNDTKCPVCKQKQYAKTKANIITQIIAIDNMYTKSKLHNMSRINLSKLLYKLKLKNKSREEVK